jgi:3-mercaptopyruvate sulfurtransferase SseA
MVWEDKARTLLKVELVRRNVSNAKLASYLRDIGVDQSERAVVSKLSRGTFSFVFFLQCMEALGIDEVALDLRTPQGVGPRKSKHARTKD